MIFAKALDTQELIKATKTGQRAQCPDLLCNCVMMSRCSKSPGFTNHWYGYHDGKCDFDWEPMSEWHSNWQNTIINPVGGVNVEVTIVTTERYKRADLKPNHGIIIEFQKSSISFDSVKERERHYKKMIWVLHTDRTNSNYYNKNGIVKITIHPKNSWIKERNPTIPIFIDRGDYLTSDSLLSGVISKDRFISKFINNDFLNYPELELNYWGHIGQCFAFYDNIIPQIKREIKAQRDNEYKVWLKIQEAERIQNYKAELRMIEEKKIRDEKELYKIQLKLKRIEEEKKLRVQRDPSILQQLLKLECEANELLFIEERNVWIKNIESKFEIARHEYEVEICQRINTELNNKQISRLDKETQERIRVDLLRVKGNLKYAAEKAHERLTRLNIISGYQKETVSE